MSQGCGVLTTSMLTLACVAAMSATAFAEDPNAPPPPVVVPAQPAPPPAEPAPAAPPPPPPGQAPGQGVVMVAQPAPYPMPMMEEDHGRFRFGIEAGAGYLFAGGQPGSANGAAINFGLRLGWQINNKYAVYYQASLPIGFAGGTDTAGRAIGGAAVAETNSALFEYTLANLLHLGLGPSLDFVAGAICSASTTSSSADCVGAAGAAFGLDGRVALTFGSVRPGRRSSFSLALDLHPIFTGGGTFFFTTLNLGYELN